MKIEIKKIKVILYIFMGLFPFLFFILFQFLKKKSNFILF